jgi:hypothetical protein
MFWELLMLCRRKYKKKENYLLIYLLETYLYAHLAFPCLLLYLFSLSVFLFLSFVYLCIHVLAYKLVLIAFCFNFCLTLYSF